MKKLMIAAAIVCAAVCSQAASYAWGNASYDINNWTGDAAEDPDLGVPMYKDGMMFLYLGTIGYEDGAFTGLDSATLVTAGGWNADEFMYGNGGSIGFSTGTVNKMGGEDYTLILVNNGSYSSLDDVKDGDYFALSASTSETTYDAVLEDNVALFVDYNPIAAGDWQKFESVPEPTSGLLMLLGMAGLALRRRRA